MNAISSISSISLMRGDSAKQLSLFERLELLVPCDAHAIINTKDVHSSIPLHVTNPIPDTPLGGGVSRIGGEGKPMRSVRATLTQGERDLLEYMLDHDYSYRAMARRFGCCSDTIKRILVREGLAEFNGAKYAITANQSEVDNWERPCIKCKSTASRPRWQYVCNKCKSPDLMGIPDDWQFK